VQLGSDLLTKSDWNARVSSTVSALVTAGVASAEAAAKLSTAILHFYRKLVIADQYRPTSRLGASIPITLVRASESSRQVELLGEDYGLGSLCDGSVTVHVVNGSHESFVASPDAASSVASIISLVAV